MSRPKVLILRTAGTNCDQETVHAWDQAGAAPRRVHVRELIETPTLLDDFAILTIPGGFSYGDDIAAGKILAMQMIHHLSDPLRQFVDKGRLLLGICNGFQVLVKAGLLPGFASADSGAGGSPGLIEQTVTLTNNDSARFEARWIFLKSSTQPNAFMPDQRIVSLPIAHGEGKLVTANDRVRRQLRSGGHMALTYVDAAGQPGPYPINPNGSEDEIAGLVDPTGRVMGLMPHPERHVDPKQHPEWTSRKTDTADGRVFFETAVRNARA